MVDGNHFFKCMSRGNYTEKLMIPKAFRTNRLNGISNCEHAKLRTKRGETWDAKVKSGDEEMWLEKGWRAFVKDNEVGDFAVFEHKGNMAFDVLLFDLSGCEKEYCSTSKKKNTTAKHKMAALNPLEVARAYKTSWPHFFKQITTTISASRTPLFELLSISCVDMLGIPINFAKSNGFRCDGNNATIRDHQKKNSQNVNITVRHEPQERVRFGSGILQFFKANDIRVGDVCVFELGKIVLYVKVFRG